MQLKLNLDYDQRIYNQYRLPLVDTNLVNTDSTKDYMTRRYQQLSNFNLPYKSYTHYDEPRTDLTNLEAGCTYYELKEFYEKFNVLHSVIVPADDVLLVKGTTNAQTINRWSGYTVCINWYINNWGTIYQYYKNDNLIDQFRPDDHSLWAIDLEQDYKIINKDYQDESRIFISYLYKNTSLNQVLADWSSHYK